MLGAYTCFWALKEMDRVTAGISAKSEQTTTHVQRRHASSFHFYFPASVSVSAPAWTAAAKPGATTESKCHCLKLPRSMSVPCWHNNTCSVYRQRKGFARSAQALKDEIQQAAAAARQGLSLEEFAARNRAQNSEGPAWKSGFASLCAFVQGSLALHRNELSQTLWPIFVHLYLDLVSIGQVQHATELHQQFAGEFAHQFADMLRKLGSIKLVDHIEKDPQVARWRTERYLVPLTERGWGLLQGWLQGGGLMDAAGSNSKKTGDKGRDHILAIINEHIELKIGTLPTLKPLRMLADLEDPQLPHTSEMSFRKA